MFEKVISSGVLIIHENTLLACLPFGRNIKDKNTMDLPKGKANIGEKLDDAAVREVYEETGLVLDKSQLLFHGVFEYKARKDLALFTYMIDDAIDLSTLHCDSHVFDSYLGKDVPEHIAYEIVKFEDVDKRFFLNLAKIIKRVL